MPRLLFALSAESSFYIGNYFWIEKDISILKVDPFRSAVIIPPIRSINPLAIESPNPVEALLRAESAL